MSDVEHLLIQALALQWVVFTLSSLHLGLSLWWELANLLALALHLLHLKLHAFVLEHVLNLVPFQLIFLILELLPLSMGATTFRWWLQIRHCSTMALYSHSDYSPTYYLQEMLAQFWKASANSDLMVTLSSFCCISRCCLLAKASFIIACSWFGMSVLRMSPNHYLSTLFQSLYCGKWFSTCWFYLATKSKSATARPSSWGIDETLTLSREMYYRNT